MKDYFIASTSSYKNGVLQEKKNIKEGYKTYDTDLKSSDYYFYIPAENIKIITSSCSIHSTILRLTPSSYRKCINQGKTKELPPASPMITLATHVNLNTQLINKVKVKERSLQRKMYIYRSSENYIC